MFNSPIMPEFPLPFTFVGTSQQLSCCRAIASGVQAHPLQCHALKTCRVQGKHQETLLPSQGQRPCSMCMPPCALSVCVPFLVTPSPQGGSSSRLLLAWAAHGRALCAITPCQMRGLCLLRKGFSVYSRVRSIQSSTRCSEPPFLRPTLCCVQEAMAPGSGCVGAGGGLC